MDSKSDLQLLKLRSSSSVISDGYRLYTNNFRKIFRITWIASLVYAVVLGFYASISIESLPYTMLWIQSMTNEQIIPQGLTEQYGQLQILSRILFLLFFLSMSLVMAMSYQIFRQHSQDNAIVNPARWYSLPNMKILGRVLSVFFVLIVLNVILFAPIVAVSMLMHTHKLGTVTGSLAIFVLTFLLFAIMLPFIYSIQRYLVSQESSLKQMLWRDYLVGWSYWGRIFAVTLIVSIITVSISIFIELPAPILGLAYMNSQQGVMMGDPSGMPEYMSILRMVVFTLAGFIQSFVFISSLFPFYYLYGSIEAKEQDRKQLNKTTI